MSRDLVFFLSPFTVEQENLKLDLTRNVLSLVRTATRPGPPSWTFKMKQPCLLADRELANWSLGNLPARMFLEQGLGREGTFQLLVGGQSDKFDGLALPPSLPPPTPYAQGPAIESWACVARASVRCPRLGVFRKGLPTCPWWVSTPVGVSQVPWGLSVWAT